MRVLKNAPTTFSEAEMISCECSECTELDPLDYETELDEMVLLGTDLMPYCVQGESGRLIAANAGGYLMVLVTYEV